MKLMKTAEEMMQFCIDNNTGYYSFKYLNHFKVIEECLQTDEYALLCFEGAQLVDLAYNSIKDRRYSFALTNKRLFMGQRSKMGDDLQIAWYKDLNDMELMNDSLLVDATKSWPCIQVVTEGVPCLQERLPGIMEEIKRQNASRRKGLQAASAADEIRKFKGLLDDGIITEEEYQRKKEQLLNADDFSESPGADVVIDINPTDYVAVDEGTAEVGVTESAGMKNDTIGVARLNSLDDMKKNKKDTPKRNSWVLTGTLLAATLIVICFSIYMLVCVEV